LPLTSATGLGSPLKPVSVQMRRDWLRLPHLHRDWASHRRHLREDRRPC
jgi:hypothetical protein